MLLLVRDLLGGNIQLRRSERQSRTHKLRITRNQRQDFDLRDSADLGAVAIDLGARTQAIADYAYFLHFNP